MNRGLFIVIILVLSTVSVSSTNVKFYNINQMFGISMRETASVCSDDHGFIWASSKTGVLRLTDDDHRFYQLPYQTFDALFAKLINKKSVLLAYTNNGQIFRYNAIYDRFDILIDLRQPLNTIHVVIGNVLIENQETFWITTNLGLYKYKANEDELILVDDDAEDFRATWYDDIGVGFYQYRRYQYIGIHHHLHDILYDVVGTDMLGADS